MENISPKKLLLAGAGHAHIGFLRQLAKNRDKNAQTDIDVTLLTQEPQTLYSGMLPGWMAGHYDLDDISIDIPKLCQRAGVRLIRSTIAKVDANAQTLTAADDETFAYHILSLNTGADTDISWIKSDHDRTTIAVRPLHHLIEAWQQILSDAQQAEHYRLAIVGAGAAATELVMAAQFALQHINPNHQAYLVCGEHLLSGFDSRFKKRVIKQLDRHSIDVIYERAIDVVNGQVLTSEQSLSADAIIAATGVTGSAWTVHTDLDTVDDGFIAVNSYQQSVSHDNVFAVGDVSTRVDRQMAHSGVHAVFGGVVVAHNLLAYLADKPLKRYQPKNRTLYLLSCGDKYAIGSWGKFSLEGRWVWIAKRYIDKRFVGSYR